MSENVKTCSRCGKEIIFGLTPKNKNAAPFDLKLTPAKIEGGKVIWVHVLHFITCKARKEAQG